MKKLAIWLLALLLLLVSVGCRQKGDDAPNTGDLTVPEAGDALEPDFQQDEKDMFSDDDQKSDFDDSRSTVIKLTGKTASCTDKTVGIAGGNITITAAGTYVVSGTLNDGTLIVDAGKKSEVHVILNGASIACSTTAAIGIISADKVIVTLADGTENTLKNGGTFRQIDGNTIDATLYSKQDLTLNGTGRLTVESPAGHGITSKDNLIITGGTYAITATEHGLDANDSIRVSSATMAITAGKDGVHAENANDTAKGFVYMASGRLDITADGDGISAGAYLQIEDGTIHVVAGGGSENGEQHESGMGGMPPGGGNPGGGMRPPMRSGFITTAAYSNDTSSKKGLKAVGGLLINGGTFVLDCADDASHANTSLTVNGGQFTIKTGDDAFHADETLTITNGTISVTDSYEGLEGLNIVVTGGDLSLVCDDDGLNAAGGNDQSGTGGGFPGGDRFGGHSSDGSIVIAGGKLYIQSSGDGIDANGTLSITGGDITICGPTQGDTATLDFDISGTISGGTFIGTGAAGMAQTFSDADQGVISLRVGNQAAGTKIVLKDGNKTLVSYEPKLDFAVVIISMPELKSGADYTLTLGSYTETVTAS